MNLQRLSKLTNSNLKPCYLYDFTFIPANSLVTMKIICYSLIDPHEDFQVNVEIYPRMYFAHPMNAQTSFITDYAYKKLIRDEREFMRKLHSKDSLE